MPWSLVSVVPAAGALAAVVLHAGAAVLAGGVFTTITLRSSATGVRFPAASSTARASVCGPSGTRVVSIATLPPTPELHGAADPNS